MPLTQRGLWLHHLFLFSSFTQCAWSCLVVGQGFKPWGAWRPSGSIPPCARHCSNLLKQLLGYGVRGGKFKMLSLFA